VSKEIDMTLICRRCGKEFVFSRAEQEFYELKGFVLPLHCKECRNSRKNQTSQVCSTCGMEIPSGKPMYCSCCLTAVHLGHDLDYQKIQQTLEEAQAKLKAIETENNWQGEEIKSQLNTLESENMRLSDTLKQKEQFIAELKEQLQKTNLELEKSLRHHESLEYLGPMLVRFQERLESIERSQIDLSNRMMQLMRHTEESRDNTGIMEGLRRLFRPHQQPHTLKERSSDISG
jgi:DNA repair exonuclease SbcCD ATPase subunit